MIAAIDPKTTLSVSKYQQISGKIHAIEAEMETKKKALRILCSKVMHLLRPVEGSEKYQARARLSSMKALKALPTGLQLANDVI